MHPSRRQQLTLGPARRYQGSSSGTAEPLRAFLRLLELDGPRLPLAQVADLSVLDRWMVYQGPGK